MYYLPNRGKQGELKIDVVEERCPVDYSKAATMTAAAAPAIFKPPVGIAAAPVKVLTTGATGVVEWTVVVQVEGLTGTGVVVGATGVGVTTGADEVQSFHTLVTGTGAGAGTEEVQSFHLLVSGTGATGVEVVQSFQLLHLVVVGTGTTGVVQSTQEDVGVVSTGAGGTEAVQSTQ